MLYISRFRDPLHTGRRANPNLGRMGNMGKSSKWHACRKAITASAVSVRLHGCVPVARCRDPCGIAGVVIVLLLDETAPGGTRSRQRYCPAGRADTRATARPCRLGISGSAMRARHGVSPLDGRDVISSSTSLEMACGIIKSILPSSSRIISLSWRPSR